MSSYFKKQLQHPKMQYLRFSLVARHPGKPRLGSPRSSSTKRPMSFLSVAIALLAIGCRDDSGQNPSFYDPPKQRSRNAITLESATTTCERWQEITATQQQGSSTGLRRFLQQQFLLFGLEEIRVDPLASSTDSASHLTVSVRGLSRDAILILATSPPEGDGNLAPLTAVAKYWSVRADPQNPPPLTVRFAVLPAVHSHTEEQVLTDYFRSRPRLLAQTKAIVLLDGRAGVQPSTNREQLEVLLARPLANSGLDLARRGKDVAPSSTIASALARLDAPAIWLPLGWETNASNCSREPMEHSSNVLLHVLQTLSQLSSNEALL